MNTGQSLIVVHGVLVKYEIFFLLFAANSENILFFLYAYKLKTFKFLRR